MDGLAVRLTSPMHPHQNGLAERSGGVVMQRMTLLLAQSGLEYNMWPLAAQASIYLLNRTPSEKNKWLSPLQKRQMWLSESHGAFWSGLKLPDLRHIRAFGCKAFPITRATLMNKKAHKLEPRGHIGYLVGYISSKHLIWVPSLRRSAFINASYVTFDETTFYGTDQREDKQWIQEPAMAWLEEVEEAPADDDGDIRLQEPLPQQQPEEPEPEDHPQDHTGHPGELQDDPSVPGSEVPSQKHPEPASATEAPHDEGNKPESPSHLVTPPPDMAFNIHSAQLTRPHRDTLPDPPRNYKEVCGRYDRQEWLQAMQKEISKLEMAGTYHVVDLAKLPQYVTPIQLKWVFTYKYDEEGYLTENKARIVVRGDLQPHTEVSLYAATLAARTFRLLMAVISFFDLEAKQYDFVNAF